MGCHGPPPHPLPNTLSSGIFRTCFYETVHLADAKTVDNIYQGISCASRVKCSHLEEDIRDLGRSFQSLIVRGKMLTYRHLYKQGVTERP